MRLLLRLQCPRDRVVKVKGSISSKRGDATAFEAQWRSNDVLLRFCKRQFLHEQQCGSRQGRGMARLFACSRLLCRRTRPFSVVVARTTAGTCGTCAAFMQCRRRIHSRPQAPPSLCTRRRIEAAGAAEGTAAERSSTASPLGMLAGEGAASFPTPAAAAASKQVAFIAFQERQWILDERRESGRRPA